MNILLGVPSSGMISESSSKASWLASFDHQVTRVSSCNSGPNYNACLVEALNACEKGYYSHHAQIHADIQVVDPLEQCRDCKGTKCLTCGFTGERCYKRWLDILIEEMEKHDAAFISVPMAIKDPRGLTSCGIGNPENRWNPWRRFCTNEFAKMPTTFTAADIGYADKYLIHNHALCVFDMRKPVWWQTKEDGAIKALFNFEERIIRDPSGRWARQQDSEDWAFSRILWELGAKTVITSRVETLHHGAVPWPNRGEWGTWKDGDEDTASQWRESLNPQRGTEPAGAVA